MKSARLVFLSRIMLYKNMHQFLEEQRWMLRRNGIADLREQGYELRRLREDVHIILSDRFGDCCFRLLL